jgi:hypothetical protein
MNKSVSNRPSAHARRPLAACIGSLFALSAPVAALATNRVVSSCLDDGSAGTLRQVILDVATVSGDTVDMSALSCPSSKITLHTGGEHLTIPQASLTLLGPADGSLTIDGSQLETYEVNYSNVLYHIGNGKLTVSHLTISGGHQSHRQIDSLGGCIYSKANVDLVASTVTSCSVHSNYQVGRGGAVFAGGQIKLDHSTVSGNVATGSEAAGGGIYTFNGALILNSTISGNAASGYNAATGGAIAAFSTVTVQYSDVIDNVAESASKGVSGGGIRSNGNLTLQSSSLSGNSAIPGPGKTTSGGGAIVFGNFLATYSVIDGNIAGGSGFGGGLNLGGLVNTLVSSTVSNNRSYGSFAGIDAFSAGAPGSSFQMRNSTVSGNVSSGSDGGLYVDSRTARLYNSTIAFNTAVSRPGLTIATSAAPVAVTLQSNLVSNNVYDQGSEVDLVVVAGNGATFNGGNLAAPANNLVRSTAVGNLPTDTIQGTCPRLGPLRDNGGLTPTHALQSGSVAIDAGNNVFGLFYDQRGSILTNGTRDYPRTSAPQIDIGALERQKDDVLFDTSFEGCPPVPV